MKTSEFYKNLSFYSNRLERDFVWGKGMIISYNSNNSTILAREGVSLPRFFEVSGDNYSDTDGNVTYFTGMKIGNGEYVNVRTNFYPSEEKSLNVLKRTTGNIATQKADIEIDSDGKVYCIFFNTTSRQLQRIQIHPARWAG